MNYEKRRPSTAAFAPYVKCIWQLRRTYRADEVGEVLRPDGCQEIIFHYGAPYTASCQMQPRAFFIGMLSHYHHLHAEVLKG